MRFRASGFRACVGLADPPPCNSASFLLKHYYRVGGPPE